MKSLVYPDVVKSQTERFRIRLLGVGVSLLILAGQNSVFAQETVTDTFDSGSLDTSPAGWQVRNVVQALGGFVENTFPTNGAGRAFRLRRGSADLTPLGQPQDYGTGRAWLFRTNDYSDFYVAMDLVDWNSATNQAIVLLARGAGFDDAPLGIPGLGAVGGYVCNFDVAQDGTESGDRRGGEFQINLVVNEATATLAAGEVSLILGHTYRVVFKGTNTTLIAQLYDLEDLTAPIVTLVADDNGNASGKSGIVTFHRDGKVHPNLTDMTVDNYYSAPSDPNADIAPAIRHPLAGIPQVVTRTPAKRFANLHPASSGISFTARTFTSAQIDAAATKLYLNGTDVSAALSPFPANGSTVTFATAAGTLKPNTIYAARIELVDTTGTLKSTNTFWFDTFTDASLAALKTVEIEDYNYSNGVYQLDPITVSGMDTNVAQVNGGGLNDLGYFNMAGTPDVDYFKTNNGFFVTRFAEYRPADRVQITQGSWYYSTSDDEAGDIASLIAFDTRIHDTQRSKYTATNVWEYQVRLTSPGDWMNYTRVFEPTNYYVYLRCGSFGATTVYLDRVTSDPTVPGQTTARLGTFNVPNHIMRLNYRYELLMNGASPAIVNLSGTNTLRLTMGGTERKDDRLVVMDYLLFVPTSDSVAIFDNFTDGDDTTNPTWQHYDPIGGITAPPASFLFTNGGYRIYAPAPAAPDAGQARAGSFVANAEFADFYVAADLIDFDDTVRQAFGIAARVRNPGLMTTEGYLFSWEPGSGTIPGTNNGDLDISPLVAETPIGQLENGTGQDSHLHLVRGKSYRFTFQGKGFDFVAKVFELPDTSTPLITLNVSDPNSLYTSGQVGLIAASQGSVTIPGDATFDNFLATTSEPRIEVGKSGTTVTLTWPLIPFRLQSSPSLSAPVWTDVASGISQAGGQNVYSVPAAGSQYFRLVYP